MEKVALVTGANRGIGLEVCKQLASKGCKVILTSRDEVKGKQALKSLKALSSSIVFRPLDITSSKSVSQIVDFITGEFGRLDILVNNAAINYDTWQRSINADLDNVKETLETNLFGSWRMVQALVPLMKMKNYGRIVNVSSGSGSFDEMGGETPGYAISKTALNVLTLKLSKDLKGTGILVNSVCPGWVRTDMGGAEAPRSVEKGAEGIVWAAQLPENGPTGKFFRDGKKISW